MKKETVMKYVHLFGIPVLTAVLGLILLVNPDSATALVSKIIGWVLVVIGAGKAISMANRRGSAVGGWIFAAACVILGVFLLNNPLILAEALGRFLGTMLAIRGGLDLARALKLKNAGGSYMIPLALAVLTFAAGAVLALLPLTLTRTIMRLCGLVAAIVGAINIAEKFREVKYLEEGSDPNIIDADE